MIFGFVNVQIPLVLQMEMPNKQKYKSGSKEKDLGQPSDRILEAIQIQVVLKTTEVAEKTQEESIPRELKGRSLSHPNDLRQGKEGWEMAKIIKDQISKTYIHTYLLTYP